MENLNDLIKSLEEDYTTYRNICSFKLKSLKYPEYKEHRKCISCDGYSSIQECEDYIDVLHLIQFYKDYKR